MKNDDPKPKICIITTIDVSLDKLFPDFYPLLMAKGYEVVGICADGPYIDNVRKQGVRVIPVPMTRTFTPFRDFVCLSILYRIFRVEKFDLIHYSTPKASFLAAIAGRLAGSAKLLYTIRGLAYTGFGGLERRIAKWCEIISARNADYVIAISPSLKQQVVDEGIIEAEKIIVYGAGSSKGVNLQTFKLGDRTLAKAGQIRKQLNLSDEDIVFGYAGRFTVEKGIVELLEAFREISDSTRNVHVLLIGEQDQRMPLPANIQNLISNNSRVHTLSYTDDMASHLAVMDIFVLASYREGFGNVLIEASALERPVIASDIPGCRDAVKPGVTGLLVKPQDSESLKSAMQLLIADKEKRHAMGQNGRVWVESEFDRNKIWQWLLGCYKTILEKQD